MLFADGGKPAQNKEKGENAGKVDAEKALNAIGNEACGQIRRRVAGAANVK